MPVRTSIALLLAASAVTASPALGASAYPAWSLTGSATDQSRPGEVAFGVTAFPTRAAVDTVKNRADGQDIALGTSNTIAAGTPWANVFGASTGRQYLRVNASCDRVGSNPCQTIATTTYVFSQPAAAGGWGFTLGDIDVDRATIRAWGPGGEELTGAEIQGSVATVPYNFEGAADQPTWNAAQGLLLGNGPETSGAAGWFRPSRAVRKLEVVFTGISGYAGDHSYRTWFAVLEHPITGTVLREDTRRPVEGDVLTLLDPEGNVLDVTTSDANGNYAFPNVYAQPGYTVTTKAPPGLTTVGPASQAVSTQAGPGRADFLLRPGTGDAGTGTSSAESSVGYSTGDAAIVLTPGLQAARVGVARRIAVESTCRLRTRARVPVGLAVVSTAGGRRSGRTVTWTGGAGTYRLVVRPVSGPARVARIRVTTTCDDGSVATATSRLRIIAAAPVPVTG